MDCQQSVMWLKATPEALDSNSKCILFAIKFESLFYFVHNVHKRTGIPGDHAEAGKIWENWIYTRKMDHHRAKCTLMDVSICQGFRNIRRVQFSFIFQLVLWMSYYNLLPNYSQGSSIIEEMLLRLGFVTKWCYILYCYYMLRDNVRN